jgi:hypothetical protein
MRNAILTLLLLFSAVAARASCYTNNMSTYESVATDGTNLTVSAVADGSYAMCSIPPGYPPNYIHHTTYSQVTLKSNNTGVTKTSSGSTTSCPTCYVTVQSATLLPIGSDTSWNFSSYDSVTCSIAGLVFAIPDYWYVDLHLTTGQNYGSTTDPKDGDPIGIYYPSCNIGQTAVCPLPNPSTGDRGWEVEFGKGETIWPYAATYFLALHWKGSNNQFNVIEACIQDPISSPTTGPLGICY